MIQPARLVLFLGLVWGCELPGSSIAAPPESTDSTNAEPSEPGPIDAQADDRKKARLARRFTIRRNLAYRDSSGRDSACDVYLPDDGTSPTDRSEASALFPNELRPAVLIVHGGGWLSGDKWTTAPYAEKLARLGCVVINMNYRLAPKHQFPKQVDDVRQALLWMKSKAAQFRIDLKRVGLYGYSAGGHLSALVALSANEPVDRRASTSDWNSEDPRWSELPNIAAVCAGGPPCDFRSIPPENRMLAYFLGGSRAERPEVYSAASPTAHVSAGDPPMRIIHGENDMLVPLKNSRELAALAARRGADCELKVIAGQGHMLTFLHEESFQHTLEFFTQRLGIAPTSSGGANAAELSKEP